MAEPVRHVHTRKIAPTKKKMMTRTKIDRKVPASSDSHSPRRLKVNKAGVLKGSRKGGWGQYYDEVGHRNDRLERTRKGPKKL